MACAFCPFGRSLALFLAIYQINAIVAAPSWPGADASAWDGDQRSAARLIEGTPFGDASNRVWRAGVEIRLSPGWKTYWRYPGDAGIAPRFDFAESENVKTVTVLWPAPEHFSEQGINLIGYKGHVILPLRVVPQDAGRAVRLRLKLDYGICENLCIPAEATAELVLPGGGTAYDPALAAAEGRVPKQITLGEGGTLAIRAIHRENASRPTRIIVDVAAPEASQVDLFVEGPTPEWALPMPEQIAASTGTRRFAFNLDGAPPNAGLDHVMLKFTAVTAEEAIEVSAEVN